VKEFVVSLLEPEFCRKRFICSSFSRYFYASNFEYCGLYGMVYSCNFV